MNRQDAIVKDGIASMDARVKSSEIDPNGQLHLDRVFKAFQDVGNDGIRRSPGFGHLEDINLVWILNSISVAFRRLPCLDERLTYKTFARGIEGIQFLREYSVTAGDVWLGGGTSSWVLADRVNHRPVRPESLPDGVVLKTYPWRCIGRTAPRWRGRTVFEKGAVRCKKRCNYSDLDANGHMNNSRFAAWLMDAAAKAGLTEPPIVGCDLAYLSELKHDESVTLALALASEMDAEAKLQWEGPRGKASKPPAIAEPVAYAFAVKEDGTICFKARLFQNGGLEGITEAPFLVDGR